jgi:cytochrome c peroxidase
MRLIIITCSCLGVLALTALIRPAAQPGAISIEGRTARGMSVGALPIGVSSARDYFKTESPAFARSCLELRQAIEAIPAVTPRSIKSTSAAIPASIARARQQLIDCRLHYKRIESFLEYFFRSSSRIYNRPPKYEAEEPDMEYQSPAGLQVIESLLFEKKGRIDKNAL